MLHPNTDTFSITTNVTSAKGITLRMERVEIYELPDDETGKLLYLARPCYASRAISYGNNAERVGWATMIDIMGTYGLQKFFYKNKEADPSRAIPIMERLIPYVLSGDRENAITEIQSVQGDSLSAFRSSTNGR